MGGLPDSPSNSNMLAPPSFDMGRVVFGLDRSAPRSTSTLRSVDRSTPLPWPWPRPWGQFSLSRSPSLSLSLFQSSHSPGPASAHTSAADHLRVLGRRI